MRKTFWAKLKFMQTSSPCSRKGTLDTQRYFCIFGPLNICPYNFDSRRPFLRAHLPSHSLDERTAVESENNSLYWYHEVDITILSFVLKAASEEHDDALVAIRNTFLTAYVSDVQNEFPGEWGGRIPHIKIYMQEPHWQVSSFSC